MGKKKTSSKSGDKPSIKSNADQSKSEKVKESDANSRTDVTATAPGAGQLLIILLCMHACMHAFIKCILLFYLFYFIFIILFYACMHAFFMQACRHACLHAFFIVLVSLGLHYMYPSLSTQIKLK